MNILKQFVPQEVCLKCDGCCRFKEKDSVWRPRVLEGESVAVKRRLADEIFLKETMDTRGRLRATSHCNHFFCAFFKAEDNTCGVYGFRPFECQLYPFVLVKESGQIVVCVHHSCPFIQEKGDTKEFREHVEYLKDFFNQKDTRQWIHDNFKFIETYEPYRSELENLFTVGR